MKKIVSILLAVSMILALTGCGKNSGNNDGNNTSKDVPVVALSEIKTAVADALGENYFPQQPLDISFFADFGLTEDMCEEFFGEMPMMPTNVDTFVAVRAAEGKVADVEAALNSYRDMLVADTMQYPMNLGKIQASSIHTIGNYVFFIQLGGDVMAAAEEGDEAVIAHCQTENEKALDAIKSILEK